MMEDSGRSRLEYIVKDLERFGHRGSATRFEDLAADYIIGELKGLGIEAVKEKFLGYTALGARILVHVVLAAIGMLFVWKLPLITVFLGVLVLVSYTGEMTTRLVLLSLLLPRSPSRNVVGIITPLDKNKASRRIVVTAHYDTQRTGLMWRGRFAKQMAMLYQKLPGPSGSPLFPVVLAFVMQPLAGLASWAWQGNTVTDIATVYIFLVYIVAVFLLAEWSVGRFVPGAGDNATGVAVLLELAERWRRDPMMDVEIVLLFTGCEETGALGAASWVKAHKHEHPIVYTKFLVLDTFAYGSPRFLGAEHTLATNVVRYRPEMVRLCGEVAKRLGMKGAGPHTVPTFTDAIPFVVNGIHGASILAFEDGVHMPNLHQMGDTSENMSFDVAWQSALFSWEVLRELAKQES